METYFYHENYFRTVHDIAIRAEEDLIGLNGLTKPLYKNVRRGLLNFFNQYLESPAPVPPPSKPQCTICFMYTDEHTTETCPSLPKCFRW